MAGKLIVPDNHAQQIVGIRTLKQWAVPRRGLSLDDLIDRMRELGNPVLEIDHDNNRLLVTFHQEPLYE